MSVIDFLKFPLPIISCSPVTNPHKYLSPLSPTITNLDEITSIPAPSSMVLNELIQLPDVALFQSILCPHAVGLTGK